jgi:peptidoglycan/LPS O-acetylase OafA/YrhL
VIRRFPPGTADWTLAGFAAASAAVHVVAGAVHSDAVSDTPLQQLWLFLLGALACRRFSQIEILVRGRALWWGLAAVGWNVALKHLTLGGGALHALQLVQGGLLAGFTISCAFTAPGLAARLLHRVDLSYGIYLYHFVVINCLVELSVRRVSGQLITFVVVVALAAFSRTFVERPALRRKKHAARAPA